MSMVGRIANEIGGTGVAPVLMEEKLASVIPGEPYDEMGSRSPSSTVFAYGLATVALVAAVILTLFIRYITGNPTFFVFYIAIFLSVWFCGRGPGWLSTILALAALHLFFRSSGELLAMTGERLPTALAFVICMVTADVLSTRRHRAERALRLARDRLELAVEDRTVELRQANKALSDEVAERKRAELALRASEERWRRLFEASSAGMALTDLTGRYVATNSAFQRMLGYTDEEFKRFTAIDITHPDERDTTEKIVTQFASGARQEYHVDKRYLKKDSTALWVNVTTTYVPPAENTPPMLQGIYFNIDDRKRAEQALRASEARWRTVFETSSVGIATSDENLCVATANAAFQRMVGYTEDELHRIQWIDLTHEDDRPGTEILVKGLLAGTLQAYNIEKRYRRKDGETIWVNVYNSHVPPTETTPAFFPAIVVDITDRINAQTALQRAQTELARAMRVTMMGELATSIAHEVNQPLAAIVGSCGACRRWLDGRDWIRAKESLETVSKAADRAGEVIKRVRSLTSNATPEYLDVDVNVAVQEVLAVLRAELRIRNTTLHLQLDNNIPHVKGDKVQLQQVVLNLVMNAIEAMTTMKDRRRVLAIKSAVEDGDVRVTVQDSGPGLDAATTERIFDPFFTTKPDGMGMGLSISKSIVENHGGRLWAAPVSGGTAFHFNVPTARRGEQWAN